MLPCHLGWCAGFERYVIAPGVPKHSSDLHSVLKKNVYALAIYAQALQAQISTQKNARTFMNNGLEHEVQPETSDGVVDFEVSLSFWQSSRPAPFDL